MRIGAAQRDRCFLRHSYAQVRVSGTCMNTCVCNAFSMRASQGTPHFLSAFVSAVKFWVGTIPSVPIAAGTDAFEPVSFQRSLYGCSLPPRYERNLPDVGSFADSP